MHSLGTGKVLKEMAAMHFFNGPRRPLPRLAQIRDNIYALKLD